jgi:hypothetical protein
MPSNAMPYVITTKRQCEPAAGTDDWPMLLPVSRQTVGTLREAQKASYRIYRDAAYRAKARTDDPRWIKAFEAWATAESAPFWPPESGGTVGPLPDGTVIEVTRATD